jgi:hypothetical protein
MLDIDFALKQVVPVSYYYMIGTMITVCNMPPPNRKLMPKGGIKNDVGEKVSEGA